MTVCVEKMQTIRLKILADVQIGGYGLLVSRRVGAPYGSFWQYVPGGIQVQAGSFAFDLHGPEKEALTLPGDEKAPAAPDAAWTTHTRP